MTNMNINDKNSALALNAVLWETGIDRDQIRDLYIQREAEDTYISFRTDYQFYEAFVDNGNFEVLGLNFCPSTPAAAGIDSMCSAVA